MCVCVCKKKWFFLEDSQFVAVEKKKEKWRKTSRLFLGGCVGVLHYLILYFSFVLSFYECIIICHRSVYDTNTNTNNNNNNNISIREAKYSNCLKVICK